MVIGDGIRSCGIYSSICRIHVFLDRLRSQVVQTYFFARDDRVYKAFTGVLDKYKNEIQKHVNRRLRWQLNVLRTTLEGRSITYRVSIENWVEVLLILVPQRKIELLSSQLDEYVGS